MKHIPRGLILSLALTSCALAPPRQIAQDACVPDSSRTPSSVRCEAVFDRAPRVPADELLKKTWAQQQWNESFNRIESDALWASLIGSAKVTEARTLGLHPLELIGDQKGARWAASRRFLDAIPVGDFALSQKLIGDVNRSILTDFQAKSEEYIDSTPAEADRFRFKTLFGKMISKYKNLAGYYRTGAHVRSFLIETFTEEAFQRLQIQKAELGLNFYEIPGSGPGRRRGFLRQVLPGEVTSRMSALISKTNLEIEAARNGTSSKDELEIIADFARQYLAIDPFPTGGPATLQAVVNRMLTEFGYPPSAMLEISSSDVATTADVVQALRTNIEQYTKLVGQTKRQKLATIADRGLGTRWSKEDYERYAQAEKKIQPREEGLLVQKATDVLKLGRQKKAFALMDDGFLHDTSGIPYVIREQSGRYQVVPIADKTYVLFASGGKLNGRQGLKRDPTEAHRDVFETNMNALEALLRGEKSERDFEIQSYDLVKKANLENEYLIESWQVPALMEAVRIQEDPVREPYAALVPIRGDSEVESRSGRTVFERAFLRNTAKVTVSDVIGQYELRELEYLKLKSFLTRNRDLSPADRQKALFEIESSRQKIHTAAREILRPFLAKVSNLSPEQLALLEKNPEYFGFSNFLRYSKLRYESFEEANKQLGDDHIIVMRATSGRLVKWLGFRTETDIRNMIEAVPASGALVNFLRSVHTDILRLKAAGNSDSVELPSGLYRKVVDFAARHKIAEDVLLTVTRRIFVSRYEFRGTAEEMEREFVTQFLHTGASRAGKTGLSTTVSPALLFKVGGDPDAAADAGGGGAVSPVRFSRQADARVFFMSLKVDDVDVAYSSLWRSQYEVYLRRGYGTIRSNLRVKEQAVDMGLLDPDTTNLGPEALEILEEMSALKTGLTKGK